MPLTPTFNSGTWSVLFYVIKLADNGNFPGSKEAYFCSYLCLLVLFMLYDMPAGMQGGEVRIG